MFKYNQAKDGAPKIGFRGGEGFPPGKFVLAFRKAKEQISEDKKRGTNGQAMVVIEAEVLQVLRKDYEAPGYKNWDGAILDIKEGVKRSHVMKSWHAGFLGDLNELACLLHGINTKNPAECRAAGVVAKDDSAIEADRVANKLNSMIATVLSEDGSNPFLDYVLVVETLPSTTDKGYTFMRHSYTLPDDAEGQAHNAAILARAGIKKAA